MILINPVCSCNRHGDGISQNYLAQLKECLESEDYFKLRDIFEKSGKLLTDQDELYYRALLNNAFYQPELSNRLIDQLFDKYENELDELERKNLYKAAYMNHYNLYQYRGAIEACSVLISDYEHLIDTPAYEHLLNERKILQALLDAPSQEILKEGNTGIRLFTDKMGLVNIPVRINDTMLNLLFDTGSSFSFIRRSIAENLNIGIIEVDFEVEGATGNVVLCDLAVIPQLNLGSVVVKNSVFWVFDDKDLTLPDYDYSVNGAVAFPILKALEEFHIIKNDSVFIPGKVNTPDYHNLAIDDLDPIVAVVVNRDTLPWYFDTGASFSSFYKPYYSMNAQMIDSTCQMQTYDIGGLGGVRQFTSYIIDSIQIAVAGKVGQIHDVEVHTDFIYKDPERVYGNLGQDFILQFDKMVINTVNGSLFFEDLN